MTTKHPAADERGRFDELAEGASNFTSSPTFFVLCLALVAAWAASFAAGNTAHHVAGDLMAAVTLRCEPGAGRQASRAGSAPGATAPIVVRSRERSCAGSMARKTRRAVPA